MKKMGLLLLVMGLGMIAQAQTIAVTLPDGREAILYEDKTWELKESFSYNFDFSSLANGQIPPFLRGGIDVDHALLVQAVEMQLQGWRYTMPRPKSSQAAWSNPDGRTTWWLGYWYNTTTQSYSQETPYKRANGHYYGDGQDLRNQWRNGGHPRHPTQLEWLLSERDGVKPY